MNGKARCLRGKMDITLVSFFIAVLITIGVANSAFTLLALCMCAIVIALYDEDECVTFLFFIFPFATLFKLPDGGTSFFTYVELAFVLFHFYRKKLRMTKDDVFACILTLYVIICECLAQTVDVNRTIKFLSNLLLLGILTDVDIKAQHHRVFINYIIGFAASGLLALMGSNYLPIDKFVTVKVEKFADGTSTARFSGLYGDPNYFTINVIISVCLILYLYHTKEIKGMMAIGLLMVFGYFIGATSSKSALFMLIVPIALFVRNGVREHNIKAFAIVFVMLIIGIYLMRSGKLSVFEYTLKRLSIVETDDVGSLTTGRTDIWKDYFTYFKKNLLQVLFGNGVGIYYLDGVATHNTYIDLIYQLGVFGTGLYVSLMHRIAVKIKISIKRNINNYVVLICIAIMYAFLSQLQEFDLPFQLAIALLMMNLQGDSSTKKYLYDKTNLKAGDENNAE